MQNGDETFNQLLELFPEEDQVEEDVPDHDENDMEVTGSTQDLPTMKDCVKFASPGTLALAARRRHSALQVKKMTTRSLQVAEAVAALGQ